MLHPKFFLILKLVGEGAPRRPPAAGRFCEPTTPRSISDFGLPPAWVLSTVLAESHLPCRIGASQPRNVVGEVLGWVEHSHTESPHITQRACF